MSSVRPMKVMVPSASRRATSPVWKNPSRVDSAVRASSPRYPAMRFTGRVVRSRQISPSSAGSPVTGSTSTRSTPGSAVPMEPGTTASPGALATMAVVSVWP